jgi:cytochrome c
MFNFGDGARFALGVALASVLGTAALGGAQSPTGLGRPATPAEIGAWGAIIGPNGEGLPKGRVTAAEGQALYERHCVMCHGVSGTEGPDDRLVGGRGTLASDQPQKTVGSYWPTAPTLWDYVNRAMPFDQPGLLTSDEVYGIVAYVLYLNDIIEEHDPIDEATLAAVEMPNRGGFVPDPRPDTGASPAPQR